ncbi:sensor histidine kinase [Paenibacillus macerans]|uniref:sensor histidine kinase n=1 Tax=Paenibacillus macerans TaxID=44252 RepID=UPI00203E804A|nr:histidine kinase [Paenibacillus macerans]MCM3701884.1 histidine kinase [Paenibacillus macerans]
MNWRSGIGAILSGRKMLLFILISLLILSLISVQGYVIGRQSAAAIEHQFSQTIVENMDSISINLANSLNYIDDFARTLSNSPDLINIMQSKDAATKQMAEKQIQQFSEYYHLRLPVNIQILTNRGEIYAYPSINKWDEQQLQDEVAAFPWFEHRVELDNNYLHWNVAADFHDKGSGNALYISKNIIGGNQSLGLLVIELNGTLIERILSRAQLAEANPIYIFSGDLETLFHTENIPPKLGKDAAALKEIYRQVKKQNQEQGSFGIHWSGTGYRVMFKQISSTPWTMVSLIPEDMLRMESVSLWRIAAIISVMSVLFIVVFFGILYTKVTQPIRRLSRIVRSKGEVRPAGGYTYKGFKEIETLYQGIRQFLQEIADQMATIRRGESEKRTLELQMLQEQMRPHFWHNSLNSLRFLAVLQGDHTMSEAVLALSKMLDYTLKNTEVRYCTVEEEIEYTLSYVRFQEIRLMRQLPLETQLDELSRQALIPKFTLQPLIENAINHGFAAPFDREPHMRIATRVEKGILEIAVTDNGNGIEPDKLRQLFQRENQPSRRSSGRSLINLRQRYRLEYGEPYGISIESRRQQFTKITVTLPYQRKDTEGEGDCE